MKNLAVLALCLCSSLSTANTMEEVVVTARAFKIVIVRLADNHVQNPITGNWHYSAPEKVKESRKEGKEQPKAHK